MFDLARVELGWSRGQPHRVDVSGGAEQGHMNHATFTIVDADHHAEDWGVETPDAQQLRTHMNLVRVR